MSAVGHRHAIITPNNRGPLLEMSTWFLMVTMILGVFTRIAVRFTTRHIPGWDDVVVIFAMLTGVASAAAISLAVNNGLGRRMHTLTEGNLIQLQKDMYIATIFYVLTIGFAKISIVIFMGRLAVAKIHKTMVAALAVFVGLWFLATLFATIFQCALPQPWNLFGGKCINVLTLWDIAGTFDMLTDAAMIILPIWIIWDLQMGNARKYIVAFIFSLRILVIATAILRLIYLHKTASSGDYSFETLAYSVCAQCQSTISVIVACTPALKPFMDNAKSGMLNASLAPRAPGTTFGSSGSYQMQAVSKGSNNSSNGHPDHVVTNDSTFLTTSKAKLFKSTAARKIMRNRADSNATTPTHAPGVDPGSKLKLRPEIVGHDVEIRSEMGGRTESLSSSDSQKGIIRQTKDWSVSYHDYRPGRKRSKQELNVGDTYSTPRTASVATASTKRH